MTGSLAVGVNLASRGLHSPKYVFCNNTAETSLHIFIQCPLACKVWSRTGWKEVLSRIPFCSVDATLESLLTRFSGGELERVCLLL